MIVGTTEKVMEKVVTDCSGPVISHLADVTDQRAIQGIVDRANSEFGSLDVIVNNAGIGMSNIREGDRFEDPVYFWDVSSEWMKRFFDVHVMGPFNLTLAALPQMRERGFGRIVTVTTSLGSMLRGLNTPYGSVKAASEALCSAMSNDLAGTGVTANILIPGGASDTRFIPDSPLRPRSSLIRPEVMGPPAVFLASRAADNFNGRRIIAKIWDTSKSNEENREQASTPIGWPSSW